MFHCFYQQCVWVVDRTKLRRFLCFIQKKWLLYLKYECVINLKHSGYYDFKNKPTLKASTTLNATSDAIVLREAMKGLGTDEEAIVGIMTHRSEQQRYLVEQAYSSHFERNLKDDLRDELTGTLESLIVGLLVGPNTYLATRVYKALHEGLITDNDALVDVLCPRTNTELAQIVAAYGQQYGKKLEDDIAIDTSTNFRKLLLKRVASSKRALDPLNEAQAKADAELLYNSGKGLKTSDEATFNMILTHRTDQHLRIVFKEYAKKAKRSIEETIREEFSGPMKAALLTIVESAQNRAIYFAKRLFRAMDGIGTDDAAITRIFVSRAEIDLGNIKLQYEKLYDKSLSSEIQAETSGHFESALLALLGQ